MAFTTQEQAIIDAGKSKGKSVDEVRQAIARYRASQPIAETTAPEPAPQKEGGFLSDLGQDFLGIGENIVEATSNAGKNIVETATRDDRSLAEKATMIGGEAIKGIGQVVGGTYLQGAKMLLPQSVEDKLAETAKATGAEIVDYTKNFYNELKTGDESEQAIATKIDEVVTKYRTDERYRDQVNAAGGFIAGASELIGARATDLGLGQTKYLSRLAPEFRTPDAVETEDFVTQAIKAQNAAKTQTDTTSAPGMPATSQSIPSQALDVAVMGAQRVVQTYRDLVEGATNRTIKILDRQALADTTGKPIEYVDSKISDMYVSAVSPGVKGKSKTVEGLTANKQAAVDAIKTITTNRDQLKFRDIETNDVIEGALPSNLWEFGGAITNQKSQTYQQVLEKIGAAANEPVDTTRIVDAMTEIIDNPVYANESAVINRAKQQLNKFFTNDYTPAQLEELIKLENDRLQAYYRGSGTQGDAVVSAIVANNLRDMLDEAVESATGSGVSDLKRQYGNLKAIENDVVHRAIHSQQAREAGLVDMFGIRTIGDVSAGLAGDVGALRRGVGQIAGEGFINALNDRDAMINRMFMVAEQGYTGIGTPPSTPQQ